MSTPGEALPPEPLTADPLWTLLRFKSFVTTNMNLFYPQISQLINEQSLLQSRWRTHDLAKKGGTTGGVGAKHSAAGG